MNYKIKSAITVTAILIIMVTVGILANLFQGGITGGGVAGDGAACNVNEDCNDGISCTIDSCKNPGAALSFCVNTPVDFCQYNDGCCPAGCKGNDNDC